LNLIEAYNLVPMHNIYYLLAWVICDYCAIFGAAICLSDKYVVK